MSPEQKKKSIEGIIDTLDHILADAKLRVTEAQDAMIHDELNQAIGALLGLDEKLQNAMALYRTVIALHREGR